jgi:hypothetical protein
MDHLVSALTCLTFISFNTHGPGRKAGTGGLYVPREVTHISVGKVNMGMLTFLHKEIR